MLKKLSVVERIDAVLEACESDPRFDMFCWEHDCGTPACVAGHAVHMFGNVEAARKAEADRKVGNYSDPDLWLNQASRILGIAEAHEFDWSDDQDDHFDEDINPQVALSRLRAHRDKVAAEEAGAM